MTILLPQATDYLNSPDHAFIHRVVAVDDGAAAQSIVIDGSNNVGIGATPTSKLHVEGSVAYAYVAKTANYTLDATDYQVNCTANSFEITLPTAVGIEGRVYSIKNTGTGTITVNADGTEEIDGELTQTLSQWDNLKIMSTNAGWIII